MAIRASTKPGEDSAPEATTLVQQWALNMQELSRWQFVLLDAQTAWWKDMERGAIDLMAPWLNRAASPAGPAVIGTPLPLPAPPWPADTQQAWKTWGQVWMNALGHDTTPTDKPQGPR